MFKNLCPETMGISGRDSEVIELALSNGFKGLDLDLVGFAEQVQTQGLARAARLITSARLKIGSFAVPVRCDEEAGIYQADLEKLAPLAEIARSLGCTRATTTIVAGSDLRPFHENFETHRRRLAEVARVLAGFDIRLGVGFLAPVALRRRLPSNSSAASTSCCCCCRRSMRQRWRGDRRLALASGGRAARSG